MRGIFLRGLWGDESCRSLEAVYLDVRRQYGWHQPEPLVVCCFGDENAWFVRRRSYDVEVLDSRPVVNFTGAEERSPDAKGTVNYGQAHWRHKLECLYWAVSTFGVAVWLDWDVELVEPLPDDFWDRMADGKPIQAALQQYHRPVAGWRTEDRRKLPSGSFIYCRDVRWVNRMIALSHAEPLLSDGALLARCIEETEGGWKGADAYVSDGYQPYCHHLGDRAVALPQRVVFQAHRSAMHDVNRARARLERRFKP